MLKNYLIFTIRNLLKHKTHAIINILGLAIGIACFLVIYLYISDELSYDRYHKNSNNIYRLVNVYDFDGVGENSASSPFPVAFTLMNDYPDMVKNTVRLFNFQAPRSFVEHEENKFNEKHFFFADSTFFDIFDYEFVSGNPETVLDEMNAVVLTESTSKRYFGEENPIGQNIKFETNLILQVTGVIKDVPPQSHLTFDFIGSISSLRTLFGGKLPQTWVWNPCWTYLVLNKNVDPVALEAEFPGYIQKYFFDAEKDNVSLYLQPLTNIHLKSDLDYEISPNNGMTSIYILSIIAIFLLIIAIINYMNLATAASSGRSKEIGIKKVNGAYQGQLVLQFIGESILLTYFALTIAVILIEILLPVFNEFTGKFILFSDLIKWQNIIFVLVLGAVIGTISGIYPAFFLASFQPLEVLTSSKSTGTKSGIARKVLVVLQFTISISLIIGTIVIRDQLNYMQNADLGFDKENIVILPINRTPIANTYQTFKDELLQSPDILSVSAMDDIFGMAHNTHEFRPEGFPEDKWQFYPAMVVHYDFIKTFGMQMVAGRDYNEANKTDPVKGMIINEAMVKHMGWKDPQDALGKKFRSLQGEERVIGVFKDFHQKSLHESTSPFVLNMKETPEVIRWFLKYMTIKIKDGNEKKALSHIENLWNKTAPDRPFEYTFLDKELSEMYKDEQNLSQLAFIFTIIIIFIAVMGLLGLSSFMAEQRTKEIGIRKVLGASTISIIKSLTSEFFKLVILSSIFAWALTWWVMSYWLDHFSYQTNLNWIIFVLSAVFALVVAILISSLRAWVASQTNPVITLKHQ